MSVTRSGAVFVFKEKGRKKLLKAFEQSKKKGNFLNSQSNTQQFDQFFG